MKLDFIISLFTKEVLGLFFLISSTGIFWKLEKYLYYFCNIPLFTVKMSCDNGFSQLHKLCKNYFPPSLQESPPATLPCTSPQRPVGPVREAQPPPHLWHTEAGHPQKASSMALVDYRPPYINFFKKRSK